MDSVSCSMQIDYGKAIVDYNQLQTRTLLSWQDDINVTKCPGCTKSFSFLKRKHHCRYCGYIYCHDCSNNVMVIPEFIKIPSCHAGYKTNRKDPMRVCNLCRHKLYQLSLLRSIIEVFNNCVEMSIQDIRGLSRVCKLWHQYANYYLSQFRSIQYELPYRKILATEKRLLWMNRGFIPGHDIWLSQLFRSIDFINDRHLTPELLLLLDQHRKESIKNKYKCRNIMCTRRCRPGLSIESALLLCDRKILSSEIVGYALETFHDMEDDKLLRYVPYLLDQGLKSPLPEIFQFLIKKCKNNVKVANELYWGIRMGLQSDNPLVINKFESLSLRWKETVDQEHQDLIGKAETITIIFENYYKHKNFDQLLYQLAKAYPDLKCTLPIAIEETLTLKLDTIEIGKSDTAPLILECICGKKIKKFLYKPDDLRQDQIVMSVISTIDDILKDEISDLHIIQYNIRPTSIKGGFIEMVLESETLESVYNKTKLCLWNYINEKNPTQTVQALREKFMKSVAAYSAITHLLGVGDRHLHNMMITHDGILFHIDYGWILGRDPKPGLGCPNMRISNDILEALGGQHSKTFEQFKDLCANKIYNTLRRHVNLIVSLLTPLVTSDPPIANALTLEEFTNQINKRFLPGETYHQAEIQFHNCIDSSTTKNYRYTLLDAFHSSAHDGIVKNATHAITLTKSYLASFLQAISFESEQN